MTTVIGNNDESSDDQTNEPNTDPQDDSVVNKYILTVQKQGSGSILVSPGTDCGINCDTLTNEFISGTTVLLVAAPTEGYEFTSWDGVCSGTSHSCEVNMNTNKTAIAIFTKINEPSKPNYNQTIDLSSFAPQLIQNVVRSNPSLRLTNALDHVDELKYMEFNLQIPNTFQYDIEEISINTSQSIFSGISLSGEVANSPLYTISNQTPNAGETVTVSVLIAGNLDAIDQQFNTVEHSFEVTIKTSEGIGKIPVRFTVENKLTLDRIHVRGLRSYDCTVRTGGTIRCDSDIRSLSLRESLDISVDVRNTFAATTAVDFSDVSILVDSTFRDVDFRDGTRFVDIGPNRFRSASFRMTSNARDRDRATIDVTAIGFDSNGARHGFKSPFEIGFSESRSEQRSETPSTPSQTTPSQGTQQTGIIDPVQIGATPSQTQQPTQSTQTEQGGEMMINVQHASPFVGSSTQSTNDEIDLLLILILAFIVLLSIAIIGLVVYLVK